MDVFYRNVSCLASIEVGTRAEVARWRRGARSNDRIVMAGHYNDSFSVTLLHSRSVELGVGALKGTSIGPAGRDRHFGENPRAAAAGLLRPRLTHVRRRDHG